MKNVILILTAFYMTAGCGGMHVKSSEGGIKVYTANELIRNIGSNKTIVLQGGSHYNLSPELFAMSQGHNGMTLPKADLYGEIFPKGLSHSECYDGPQLNISGLKDLTITCSGNSKALITVDARYAYVLNFIDCENIRLENLILGHTKEGYCEGGVIGLKRIRGMDIGDCELYGSGTEGITAEKSYNLRFINSCIRDCSYSIMTIENCLDFLFTESRFYKNKEFSLINISGGRGEGMSKVSFVNCSFYENKGILFDIDYRSPVTLTNCIIRHPRNSLGTLEMIEDDINNTWFVK